MIFPNKSPSFCNACWILLEFHAWICSWPLISSMTVSTLQSIEFCGIRIISFATSTCRWFWHRSPLVVKQKWLVSWGTDCPERLLPIRLWKTCLRFDRLTCRTVCSISDARKTLARRSKSHGPVLSESSYTFRMHICEPNKPHLWSR